MLGGLLANPAGLASDSPQKINTVFAILTNTHQHIVGAGYFAEVKRDETRRIVELIGLGVCCSDKSESGNISLKLKPSHQDGSTLNK